MLKPIPKKVKTTQITVSDPQQTRLRLLAAHLNMSMTATVDALIDAEFKVQGLEK